MSRSPGSPKLILNNNNGEKTNIITTDKFSSPKYSSVLFI